MSPDRLPFQRTRVAPFAACVLALLACAASLALQASTLVVTSLADSGAGTLRQAVLNAVPGDTVSIPAGAIALLSPIDINKPLTVAGAGANATTVSGSGATRMFNVSNVVTIADLALINGLADALVNLYGGAIYNTGNLSLLRVALRSNSAADGGGAIYNVSTGAGSGILLLRGCELSGNAVSNVTGAGGGAILSTSTGGTAAQLTIVNSTLTNNNAGGGGGATVGGAIYASRGSVRIYNSTIDANGAGAAGANLHMGTVVGTGLLLRNSIVGDAQLNFTAANADQDIFVPTGSAFTSQGYNLVQRRPSVPGLGATDAADGTAPALAALANNGGTTFTRKPLAGSAALSFVPLASCVDDAGSPLLTDQRNSARRATGTYACDAGAFETAFLTANAFSRKQHGGIPYSLPLNANVPVTGAVTVEPRVIGSGHNIVFQFGSAVSSVGGVRVVDAAGAAIGSAGAPVIAGNEVGVNLTGIADARRVNVTLLGVNGSFNTGVSVGFLVGDVIGSRTIGTQQASAEKSRAAQAVSASNFLYDINLSGRISAADISGVKARSSRSLP